MSTILYPARLTSLPNPTAADTLYFISHAPGELKIALTNASNTLIYETITSSEVATQIEAKLAEAGGVYDILNILQAQAHTHQNLDILNNIGTINIDGGDYLQYNGVTLRPILTQEDW